MHMHHLAIRVKDIEASVRFYETLVGLTVRERKEDGGARLAFLTNAEGATEIEFIQIPDDEGVNCKGMFICFATAELEKAHEVAVKANMNPSDIREPSPDARYFYAYDPNGISVQLREYF